MKAWEKINQIKETDEPRQVIRDWAYMNRICPIIMEDGLELDPGEYPKELEAAARQCCENSRCTIECLDRFLDTELGEGEDHGETKRG